MFLWFWTFLELQTFRARQTYAYAMVCLLVNFEISEIVKIVKIIKLYNFVHNIVLRRYLRLRQQQSSKNESNRNAQNLCWFDFDHFLLFKYFGQAKHTHMRFVLRRKYRLSTRNQENDNISFLLRILQCLKFRKCQASRTYAYAYVLLAWQLWDKKQ